MPLWFCIEFWNRVSWVTISGTNNTTHRRVLWPACCTPRPLRRPAQDALAHVVRCTRAKRPGEAVRPVVTLWQCCVHPVAWIVSHETPFKFSVKIDEAFKTKSLLLSCCVFFFVFFFGGVSAFLGFLFVCLFVWVSLPLSICQPSCQVVPRETIERCYSDG